jgi:filamentous hemagglutinin family protein
VAKSNKTFPKTHALSKLAIAIFCANSGLAVSAPELNNISTGNADISGLGTDVTIIDQTVASATPVVTIDWATFNVGENQTVNFVQNSSDIAINNIGTGGASQILGKINADGTVFLQNTNGFVFGANSIINTGAFLATTSTISLDSADTISLEETNTGGSIEINQGASISANNQASGGYLAFISNNISIGSNAGLVSDDSGLSANQGEVLISSDVNSNIKLSGLNINFPASSLTESNKTDNVAEIDITNANISATSVILSSDNLTDLLNSVINQPVSISSDHLILSGKALGGTDTYSITQGIKEAVDTYSEVNSDLNFSELTLEDRSDSGNIEFTTNISIKDEIDLNLRSNTISFNGGNIAGSDSNLTLNASNIEIGYFQNNFGGSSGLGSLTLNGGFSSNNNGIIIKGSINTKNDIIMNGDVTILRDNADHADSDGIIKTSFRSEFGQLSINDSLNFDAGTSAQTGKLYIRTGGDLGISLGETKGFSEIDLNAGRVSLNGDLTATNSISINNIDTRTNIEINNPVNSSLNLSANNISFEDFIFSSSTSGDLNFNVTGDGSVSLKNSHASEETPITSVNIQNIGTDNETDVIISGDFNTTNFSVGSETTSNTFSLSLAGDSSFTNISKFDLSQAEIIDSNYQLSLEGITREKSTASA